MARYEPMTAEALMQAVLDAPDDDDAPRLVYADYLEERGEAPRAEFIRIQCELASLPMADERRASLEAKDLEHVLGFREPSFELFHARRQVAHHLQEWVGSCVRH